jgi:hypothetical protein
MERVREAVDLARRSAARAAPEAAAGRRRRSSSTSSQQQPSQASAEAAAIDDASVARSKLARLLPDTPTDQLLASLVASSVSGAGELKVRGEEGGERRGRKRERVDSKKALD